MKFVSSVLLLLLSTQVSAAIHHQLDVQLDPVSHKLVVVDKLSLPPSKSITFQLHQNLTVQAEGGRLTAIYEGKQNNVPVTYYRLVPDQTGQVTLRYSGLMYAAASGELDAGTIREEGVYLSGSSAWYPQFEQELVSFELQVSLPEKWGSVSQGVRQQQNGKIIWSESALQDEIYLLAAPFNEYQKDTGGFESMVFLRSPDKVLAQQYINLTEQYVAMYQRLLGAYPYRKFALVENFWETGYGMPSFTLLGSKVIRMPFIQHSSFPHEILHNWWGNGVYVDYQHGNWSEGLTSYLADHLIQEQRGQGSHYRRNTLQAYADFVSNAKDFPLTEFRTRHNVSAQAVGYGKTLMLFHMLRQHMGDILFTQFLRKLYSQQKFKLTSWQDIVLIANQTTGQDLNAFFQQWTTRTGAPELRLQNVQAVQQGERWHLLLDISQAQAGDAYPLNIPLAITLANQTTVKMLHAHMSDKQLHLDIVLDAQPVRVDIDPEFDLFRRLDRAEVPPALSQIMGAEKILFVLPALADDKLQQQYRNMIVSWQQEYALNVETVLDSQLAQLPTDRTIWLFGWQNRFKPDVAEFGVTLEANQLQFNGNSFNNQQYSVLLTARHGQQQALAWLAADNVVALTSLSKRLPHYRTFSYAVFSGDEAKNIQKGQWQTDYSPLSHRFADNMVKRGQLAERKALVDK